MHPWQPEHPVDAELARRLLATCQPTLADHPPRHLGSGWDVDVWAFGDTAVRFPRRAAGAACLDNELRVLPALADLAAAGVDLPRPAWVGAPALGYPARFYGHPVLPGRPLARAGLDDADLARLAVPLARVLAAVHTTPPAPLVARGVTADPRGDVTVVAARGRTRLATLDLPADLAAAARAILDEAAPGPTPTTLIHGDCHAANLLVDGARATAVIDWGDAALGDPAVDLAAGWSALPPAARADFLDAYRAAGGPLTAATWARARVHALSRQVLALLAWSRDLADTPIIAWSERALARVLA